MTPADMLLRARRHEVGHALVSFVLSLEPPRKLVVHADGSGQCHWPLPLSWEVERMSSSEWRELVEAQGVSAFAGQAALELFGDPDPGRGAREDRLGTLRAAQHLTPDDPNATVAHMRLRGRALVREHREGIEWLVRTLAANRDTLEGPDLIAALRNAQVWNARRAAGAPPPR